MGQLVKAFLSQLSTLLGEVLFAQGLFPTADEQRRRSTSTLASMLIIGNLTLLWSTALLPATLVAWVLTGRGPGQRLLMYSGGGPRVGRFLVARASESGALRQERG